MQNLYYLQASSSLVLIPESGSSVIWEEVSSLTINSSSLQIEAKSGSVNLAYFPVDGTNLYYAENLPTPIRPPGAVASGSISNLTINYSLTDVESGYVAGCGFSISSSVYTASYSGSDGIFAISMTPTYDYRVVVAGSGSYTSYLWMYDTTSGSIAADVPGVLLTLVSASNTSVSASVYASASHNYTTYLQIVGPPP